MYLKSVLTDVKLKENDLSETEQKVYNIVLDYWPSSALEIADHLGDDISTREKQKRASTKYTYYLKKLIAKELVIAKLVGNALVVWPLVAEKYRTIHKILEEKENVK